MYILVDDKIINKKDVQFIADEYSVSFEKPRELYKIKDYHGGYVWCVRHKENCVYESDSMTDAIQWMNGYIEAIKQHTNGREVIDWSSVVETVGLVAEEDKLCLNCMEEHSVKIVQLEETTTFKGEQVHYLGTYEYCENTESYSENEDQMKLNNLALKKCTYDTKGIV